ncbi:MAG: alpha/beta fold hydrolase [Acidimicrobiales bacterium]|nr:alpha/beta fold hydrolase [Acidimicrobiales bacterium]
MPRASANGVELEYECLGDPADPTLLLVNGLGAQLVSWEDEFLHGLLDRGFRVVRFDNRDAGRSTWFDGRDDSYALADMAADAAGLLDALEVPAAHVFGTSMGGMIAQQLCIDHPERVRSLTSVMSTTGDPDVGQPAPGVLEQLVQPVPRAREAYLDRTVAAARGYCSPEWFDADRARARFAREYDRAFHPEGTVRQFLAIATSGSRSDALRAVRVPTLVIHGDADALVDVSGGRRTAEVVPGAELMVCEGMGHDLPTVLWGRIIEAVTLLAARAEQDPEPQGERR